MEPNVFQNFKQKKCWSKFLSIALVNDVATQLHEAFKNRNRIHASCHGAAECAQALLSHRPKKLSKRLHLIFGVFCILVSPF